MNPNPMRVSPEDTMHTAKNIMKENGLTGLPVVDGNRLAGILSLYDIMACYDNGSLDDKVSKYMSRDVILLEEEMPISFASPRCEMPRYSSSSFSTSPGWVG